jgi:hypothetical protein
LKWIIGSFGWFPIANWFDRRVELQIPPSHHRKSILHLGGGVKALLKAAASGATGVNITESSSGVKFEFIRKQEDE